MLLPSCGAGLAEAMQVPMLANRFDSTGHFHESFPIIAAFGDSCFALTAIEPSAQRDRLQLPEKVIVRVAFAIYKDPAGML